MRLKVYRYDGGTKKEGYDIFEVKEKPGMTVLSSLFYVQENLDDSLSFRHSCRGAVCGTCAMLINKVPRLACKTQVSKLLEGSEEIELKPYPAIEVEESLNTREEILIEPLPHLPVIKDLIVDMKLFFDNYKKIEPIFKRSIKKVEKESLMDPSDVFELEKYTNCVLCAACSGACPVNGSEDSYLGPAALAKLYRFYIDPREDVKTHDLRLLLANDRSGWYGCEFHTNCTRVCPKGVTPNIAIGKARQKLSEMADRKREEE
ncbi:MAG: succinate dehydrogenase/fumarate reductase iron-sulfur subunit [Halobacteriota archaeon]|nr:succinate dehydrogenase/fumarate reductase iron-sulfur subunit [Halobacteriota archaeon]